MILTYTSRRKKPDDFSARQPCRMHRRQRHALLGDRVSSQTFYSGRKVIVTGAGGFIGSHLVEALLGQGAQVRAMLRYTSRPDRGNLEFLSDDNLSQIEIIRGDLRDPHFMLNALADQEIVFHLAALIAIPYSYIAPSDYVATNITGTLNVLESARRNCVQRVIHTSTSEAYGTAQFRPIDETHPLVGQSPYSASKIGADKLAESFHRSFGLPVVTVRPFNTYGPRQSRASSDSDDSGSAAGRPGPTYARFARPGTGPYARKGHGSRNARTWRM